MAAIGMWSSTPGHAKKRDQDAEVGSEVVDNDNPGSALSFREGVWFAVSILPLTPGRGIFIPRADGFRRDCERRFTARTRSVLYAVKHS